MKKILFVSKYLSTRNDGFETRLSNLIRSFKENYYQVAAITSSDNLKNKKIIKDYLHKKIDRVDYYYLGNKSYYSYHSFGRIFSWLKFEYKVFRFKYSLIKFKPEIIYISSLSLLTILNGYYLKKKFNAKLVFEMRDLWPYFLYKSEKYSKFNPLVMSLGWIEKFGIYQSDLIISLIPRVREYLLYRGFKKKNFYASTFPVNKKYFIKKKNNFKLDKSKFNLCYAGNFGFDNYLVDLLDLISKVKNNSFQFHFIGDGSQKNYLKQKYSHITNVVFHKKIKYENLHSVLLKMDCLMVSFGYNKKFPNFGYELNKINNYIMASKPIIVVGEKKNLYQSRGKFIFVEKKTTLYFIKC